ncbi:hypothetical protein BS47DRAFT_1386852 [Hydnum rufescens UP504]|uniref:Uncharacterized protein n=1 Tax=Hydnum rufescens UP504 TaxID=1448309 RepID=A0A9P6BB82_9AGAM|nr:hypothetical protein BS47DRAFT_1386852 [Hydnum rufescens UP504]
MLLSRWDAIISTNHNVPPASSIDSGIHVNLPGNHSMNAKVEDEVPPIFSVGLGMTGPDEQNAKNLKGRGHNTAKQEMVESFGIISKQPMVGQSTGMQTSAVNGGSVVWERFRNELFNGLPNRGSISSPIVELWTADARDDPKRSIIRIPCNTPLLDTADTLRMHYDTATPPVASGSLNLSIRANPQGQMSSHLVPTITSRRRMEKFQQGVLEIALVIVKVSRRDMVISRCLDREDDLG